MSFDVYHTGHSPTYIFSSVGEKQLVIIKSTVFTSINQWYTSILKPNFCQSIYVGLPSVVFIHFKTIFCIRIRIYKNRAREGPEKAPKPKNKSLWGGPKSSQGGDLEPPRKIQDEISQIWRGGALKSPSPQTPLRGRGPPRNSSAFFLNVFP